MKTVSAALTVAIIASSALFAAPASAAMIRTAPVEKQTTTQATEAGYYGGYYYNYGYSYYPRHRRHYYSYYGY